MKKKKKEAPSIGGGKDTTHEPGPDRQKTAFFRQWIFFLAISIFYIWIIRLISNPVYLISDNPAILNAAQNGFLAPFVHFLWSRLLTGLYALSPQVPWYGLGLYALHAVSLSLVLTVFYRVVSSIGFFCLFALITIFFWSDMIVRLDFNGASIMTGAGAVLLFFLLHREGRLKPKTALFTGIFLAVAVLPRFNGFLAAVTAALPFLGAVFFMAARQNNRSLKALARMALLFTLLIFPGLLVYGANGVYRANFLTQEEAAYNQFNKLRGLFHGFPISIENINNPQVLKATGWTGNDYMRLLHWMIFDENIYNVETFEKFYAHAASPGKNIIKSGEIISTLSSVLKEFSPFFLLMAGGLGLAWGRRTYALPDFLLCGLAALGAMGLAFAMAIFLRFPYHIGYPMLFSAGLFLFFLSVAPIHAEPLIHDGQKNAGKADPATSGLWKNLSLKLVFPAAVLAAMLIHGNMLDNHYKMMQGHRQFYGSLTQHINTQYPGAFLFAEPMLSPFLFSTDPINPPVNKFSRIPLGASAYSPLFYHELKKMGLSRGSELMPAMIARDDILVLSGQAWMQLLVNYAQEHGFGLPRAESLGSSDNGQIQLYRLR